MNQLCFARVFGWVFAALVCGILLPAALGAETYEKSTHMVPMRDGVRLATDVFVPKADEAKAFPVVLARTPYNKNGSGKGLADMVRDKGYAVVVQDMRGRFASEGDDHVVFHNDGWAKHRDGEDTFHWLAQQPWCNGNVGTWGGSALGIVQNMQAPVAPDSLKAQCVIVASSDLYQQTIYQGGAFRKSLVEGWLKLAGFSPANLERMLEHPGYDDFWAETNAEPMAPKVRAPAIYHGGWYDIHAQGTINSFVTIHNQGGGNAKGNCRLIMGAWAHGPLSGLKYPANEKPPKEADPVRFFDYWVRGIDNGVKDDKPVHYYVMGDPETEGAPGNFWRTADNWPPPAEAANYYLHADGTLSAEPPQGDEKRTFKYDPADPVPTVGGQNLLLPKGPMDQRSVESRGDVLVFSTEPLEKPIEVTGRILARLYVESDRPDTDFTVKLTDVYPDGRSMLVTDGILRCRYRESFERETPMKPGKVYEITVDLWSTSLIFNQGHRIRIAVSSSNHPRFDANPNTGKRSHFSETKEVATNTVWMSKERPSHVVLPVYAREGDRDAEKP